MKDATAATLGARLRWARKERGLKQVQLSDRAAVDRKTLYNLEKDRTDGNIGLHVVERLAWALDVSPSWLAFGVDAKKAQADELLRALVERKREWLTAAQELEREGLFGEVRFDDDLLAGPDPRDEDRDDDDCSEDDSTEADLRWDAELRRSRAEFPVWPHGYRSLSAEGSLSHQFIPPLPQEFAPLFAALSAHMDEAKAAEVGEWLLPQVWADEDDYPACKLRGQLSEQFLKWLLSVMPQEHHVIAQRTVAYLQCADASLRGMTALQLIYDGGVTISLARLQEAIDAIPDSYKELRRAARLVKNALRNYPTLSVRIMAEYCVLPPHTPMAVPLLTAADPEMGNSPDS